MPPLQRSDPPALRRWLAFVAVVVGCVALLLLLPRPFSSFLFLALLVASAWLGYRSSVAQEMQLHRMLVAQGRRVLGGASGLVARHRSALAQGLALVACLLLALGASAARPENTQVWLSNVEGLKRGVLLMGLGGALLGAVLYLRREGAYLPAPSAASLTPPRSRWWQAGLGALGMAMLAEANAGVFGLEPLVEVPHHIQFVLLCASIALLVWGLGGLRWSFSRSMLRQVELWALLGIVVLAFVLRFWALGESVRVLVDELNFMSAIRYFWADDSLNLLERFSGIIAFPRIYPYLQAQAVQIFGRNLVGLRATSAVLGTLTVPALYVLARALFDRRTAFLAAILLATFPPHVHFSRLGLNNVADPLFGTLAMAFLARGLRGNRRLDYAVGGAALGLTQYFYEGGRLLYPPLVVAWLGQGMLAWRPRPRMSGLSLAALTALVVAGPIYYVLLGTGAPLMPRMSLVGLNDDYWHGVARNGLQDYSRHLADSFLMYFHLPESSLFYAGDQPLLLTAVVPAVGLGLFYALWRLRAPGTSLALLWLVMASVGNSLLVSSTQSPRYVVVFPALMLLAAVGLRHTVPLILPGRSRLQAVALLVLGVGLATAQVDYYFGPHLQRYNVQVRRGMDAYDAILRSVAFPPGTRVHLVSVEVFSASYATDMLSFFVDDPHVDVVAPQDVSPEYLAGLPRNVDHAFFVERRDRRTPALLRQHFHLQTPAYTPYEVPDGRALILYYAPCCPVATGVPEEDQPPPPSGP